MIILVNETYRIESDSHCWMVQRYRGVRKGTDKADWKPITFHSDFKSALVSLSEHRIRSIASQATADEIRETLKQIRDEALTAADILGELRP